MTTQAKKWLTRAGVALLVGVLAALAWQRYGVNQQDDRFASGNGRIEGTEIDVAAKSAGRVSDVLVNEGDLVSVGQVVARMDTATLRAQVREAQAQLQQAHSAVATAQSQLAQRESEKAAGQAAISQRQVELNAAKRQLSRSMALAEKGFISAQVVDDDQARVDGAEAAVNAARAQVSAAEAAIANARSQLVGARSTVTAMQANVERVQADIDDSDLRSSRDGRVQYIVARAGEVVAAGGRVLNIVDLTDVYMTFFLPTAAAGRVAFGTEVRLVLDAAPQYVIPARVSFVADVAQFTPKTVETASEREKLMFRIRAQIPADLLKKHIRQVKTGLPGMAHVRLDPNAAWPAHLQVNLPE